MVVRKWCYLIIDTAARWKTGCFFHCTDEEDWNTKKLNGLPKVTQKTGDRAGLWVSVFNLVSFPLYYRTLPWDRIIKPEICSVLVPALKGHSTKPFPNPIPQLLQQLIQQPESVGLPPASIVPWTCWFHHVSKSAHDRATKYFFCQVQWKFQSLGSLNLQEYSTQLLTPF